MNVLFKAFSSGNAVLQQLPSCQILPLDEPWNGGDQCPSGSEHVKIQNIRTDIQEEFRTHDDKAAASQKQEL